MSLIAYDKGILLADRIGITMIHNVPFTSDMQKLHVDTSKMYAFAYSGQVYLKRHLKPLNDAIRSALGVHYVLNQRSSFSMSESALNLLKGRAMIIMTRDQVFVRLGDSDGVVFDEIDLSEWMASGTYNAAWRVCREFGLAPVPAAQRAVKYLMDVEPTIDSIKQKDLKPFPLKEFQELPNIKELSERKLAEAEGKA